MPGFDIVIGNPPYIGEKGNNSLFQDVRNASSLRKFYQGKIDYYYFFFHLALDVLKDNGILSFITTSYFTTSTAGNNLRNDLKKRGSFLEIIDFNELRIFKSAQGQHNMISTVIKDNQNYSCSIIQTLRKGHSSPEQLKNILYNKDEETSYKHISSDQIFEGNSDYIRLSGNLDSNSDLQDLILDKISVNSKRLDSYFYIKNGVQTACDKVKKTSLDLFKNDNKNKIQLNDGIFVLDLNNQRDVDVINSFNKEEKKFLKDFYKNSNIKKYSTDQIPTKKLLYIEWDFKINKYENIKRHLLKFSKILKNRLAVEEKRHEWHVISWPRKENIFNSEKILAPYRANQNIFGYNKIEWFCSADCYVIFKKTGDIEMLTLLGILNSKLFYFWLYMKGKRKGNTLELYFTPLSEIPLKILDSEHNEKIKKLLISLFITKDNKEKIKIVNQIDSILYQAYQLSDNEINYIENFFLNHTNKISTK